MPLWYLEPFDLHRNTFMDKTIFTENSSQSECLLAVSSINRRDSCERRQGLETTFWCCNAYIISPYARQEGTDYCYSQIIGEHGIDRDWRIKWVEI